MYEYLIFVSSHVSNGTENNSPYSRFILLKILFVITCKQKEYGYLFNIRYMPVPIF